MANLLEAHGRAYRILHDEDRADADGDGRAARGGLRQAPARSSSPTGPGSRSTSLRARVEDRVFNARRAAARPVTGEIALSIPGARGGAAARARAGAEPRLPRAQLLHALDGARVRARAARRAPRRAAQRPRLGDLARAGSPRPRAARPGPGVPVLVTEHGFADAADALRPRALVESLLGARPRDRGAARR